MAGTYVLTDCPCCPTTECGLCAEPEPLAPPSTGLVTWLAADLGITGLSDGDPIDLVTDQSSAGNDATQTGGARPIYKTGILYSLPVMRFNGSDQYMNMTNNWPVPPFSFFAVWQAHTTDGYLLGAQPGGPAYSVFLTGSPTKVRLVHVVGEVHPVSLNNRAVDTWYATGLTFDVDLMGGYWGIPGTPRDPCTDGANSMGADFPWTSEISYLGASYGAMVAGFLDGDIAELLVYNQSLNLTGVQNALCYLMGKYDL